MKRIIVGKYTRVNAVQAKNLFEKGHTIRVCPCNCNPMNGWGLSTDFYPAIEPDWNYWQNQLRFYWGPEHMNKKYGQYLAYYVETEVLDK